MERVPEIWTDSRKVGAFFGVSQKTIQAWIAEGCPGENGKYDLFLMAEWWGRTKLPRRDNALAKRQAERRKRESTETLKRRRLEQQIRSDDLKYATAVGAVVPKEHVLTILAASASAYRNAGEILRRSHGAEAQEIVLNAIETSEKAAAPLLDDSTEKSSA